MVISIVGASFASSMLWSVVIMVASSWFASATR